MGWRQSKTTGETLHEKVVGRPYAPANNKILAGDDSVLDATEAENYLEQKREAEKRQLHRLAKVHDYPEMWQGSQNFHATWRESHAQKNQMTALGYISDTEEIITAPWANFQHDSAAAFKLLERSPQPPAFLAQDLLGGQTQIWNVRRMKKIDRHPAESDEDSLPFRYLKLAQLKC